MFFSTLLAGETAFQHADQMGQFFLQALADEMGQQTLDAFLRDYVDVYRWQISSTEGFRALAEQHCACDLELLFRSWVYPP